MLAYGCLFCFTFFHVCRGTKNWATFCGALPGPVANNMVRLACVHNHAVATLYVNTPCYYEPRWNYRLLVWSLEYLVHVQAPIPDSSPSWKCKLNLIVLLSFNLPSYVAHDSQIRSCRPIEIVRKRKQTLLWNFVRTFNSWRPPGWPQDAWDRTILITTIYSSRPIRDGTAISNSCFGSKLTAPTVRLFTIVGWCKCNSKLTVFVSQRLASNETLVLILHRL